MEAVLPITQMPELVIAATKHGFITPEEALTIAAAMEDIAKRGVVYARVVSLDGLSEEQITFMREQSLKAALELSDRDRAKRGDIMAVLVPYLDESDYTEAMSLILEIDDKQARDYALDIFAVRLDESWRRQLFRVAMSYPDSKNRINRLYYPREDRLISVAPYIPASKQMRLFNYAMQINTEHHKNLRAKIFFALAPYADATLRQYIYENRHSATTLTYEQRFTLLKVLSGLLQQAKDGEKDRYVTDLMDGILNHDGIDLEQSANYVQKLAHDFAPHLTKMQLDAIVHMILELPASRSRCFALAALLPYVDVGLRRLVIEEGLSMIPQLQGYYDVDANDEVRANALARFAPYVTDNLRVRYLRIARSLDSRERSNPLRELAVYTDDETQKNALLDEAWNAAVNLPFAAGISHRMNDQRELKDLMPHLTPALYDKTIEYALKTPILHAYNDTLMRALLENPAELQETNTGLRISLVETMVPYLNTTQLQTILDNTDLANL